MSYSIQFDLLFFHLFSVPGETKPSDVIVQRVLRPRQHASVLTSEAKATSYNHPGSIPTCG